MIEDLPSAEKAGHARLSTLSQSSVVNILNAAEIKPFKIKYYFESRDPEFEDKIHNVLVVYKQLSMRFDEGGNLLPYEGKEPENHTISYNEKPGIQAIATTSPDLPPIKSNGVTVRDYLLSAKLLKVLTPLSKSSAFIYHS